MRKKWTIVCIMFLALVIIVIGCQKRQSTKEVYKDFQKQISDMNYYSCKAEVEVVGNKSPHNYVLIHTYKNR